MSNDLAKTIGAGLRKARKALQLTQEDVAERIDVTRDFYARLERGTSWPSMPTFARLVAALGASADALLGRSLPILTGEPARIEDAEMRRIVRRLRKASPGARRLVNLLLKEMAQSQQSNSPALSDSSESESSPRILDTPRMSGTSWFPAGDLTADMLNAWPIWELLFADASESPSVHTRAQLAAFRFGREWEIETGVRPLRLPGMNERGEVDGADMTDEHLARTEWQVLEPHGNDFNVPMWFGVPSRTNDVKAVLAGRRDRKWRPAIFATLDAQEVQP